MLAGHFTTCVDYLKERGAGGGGGWVKREITSHLTTSLHNYSNVAHVGWLPRQRG